MVCILIKSAWLCSIPGWINTEVAFTANLEAATDETFAAIGEDVFLHPNVNVRDKQLRKIKNFDFIFLKIWFKI
ncbi:hypothetical protein GCM10022210_07870 [Mucilaginibacter dorajii]|uniref:Uncharacterized protein n=1 Tax=Mucilaginibacter dorajii TaxID=692994 RepID=A0ABP7PAL6_9SPHI